MTPSGRACLDDRTSWDTALALHREQLKCYLEYLLQCECSHQILANVKAEVRERSVPDEFKLGFLVRILVQNVIRHLRECTHAKQSLHCSARTSSKSIANISVQERLVYFMRDVLEYSTRDTSLLIGISDNKVAELLSFARKRIGLTDGPPFLEVETPEWAYFRWKFVDLS